MQGQFSVTNQNDNIVITIPNKSINHVIAITTDSAAAGGCNLVVEIPASYNNDGINGAPNTVKTWVPVGLYDAIANASVAGGTGITGASKYAWADVPGADRVRIRRTDATGTASIVGYGLVSQR